MLETHTAFNFFQDKSHNPPEDKDTIILGLNAFIPLTSRRFRIIMSAYDSLLQAIEDNFGLLKAKDFDKVRSLSLEEITICGECTIQELDDEKIEFVLKGDARYPSSLALISDSPTILYFRGDLSLINQQNQHYLACVGSRSISHQTKIVLGKLFTQLQGYKISVISGLAAGVDSEAHIESLCHQLPCIGVLGTSLFNEDFYPLQSAALARDIVQKGGLIISEYGKKEGGRRFNFVRRNRIIAALSDVIFVVQASLNSGSCTTGEFGFEYHKSVLSLAGLPFDDMFAGNHSLIKKGAHVVLDAMDILDSLKITKVPVDRVLQNNSVSHTTKESHMSSNAQAILNRLSLEPLSTDDLMGLTNLDLRSITQELLLLELQGNVVNIGSNEWIKS